MPGKKIVYRRVDVNRTIAKESAKDIEKWWLRAANLPKNNPVVTTRVMQK